MRIRGSGAARIYDAAGGVLAGLRQLRIVARQLPAGQRPSVSRAPQPLHSPGARLRPRRSADRKLQLTRQSWLLAYPPFGSLITRTVHLVAAVHKEYSVTVAAASGPRCYSAGGCPGSAARSFGGRYSNCGRRLISRERTALRASLPTVRPWSCQATHEEHDSIGRSDTILCDLLVATARRTW